MKSSTLLVLGLLAVAAYFVFKDRFASTVQAPADANPQGGAVQGANEPDAFGAILGAVTQVFATIKTIAQTNPQTT